MPPLTATGTEAEGVAYPIISVTMPTTQLSYGGTSTGIGANRANLTAFRDGYVDSTDGDDLIDATYAGDVDKDRVDASDAILPGTTGDDDIIRAGLGNDTVWAGAGADSVRGGDGNDSLYG